MYTKTLQSLIEESGFKVVPQSWGWQLWNPDGSWHGQFTNGSHLKRYLQYKINIAKGMRVDAE